MRTLKIRFKPTEEMIKAAELTFAAMAHADTIRPLVREYQERILEEEKYEYSDKISKRRGKIPTDWIKKESETYMMDDQDFQHYMTRCEIERNKIGLKTKSKEYCPLLIAESNLRDAQHLLLDEIKPITGIDGQDLLCIKDGLKHHNDYIDLTLRLLAPYVKNSNDVMREITR